MGKRVSPGFSLLAGVNCFLRMPHIRGWGVVSFVGIRFVGIFGFGGVSRRRGSRCRLTSICVVAVPLLILTCSGATGINRMIIWDSGTGLVASLIGIGDMCRADLSRICWRIGLVYALARGISAIWTLKRCLGYYLLADPLRASKEDVFELLEFGAMMWRLEPLCQVRSSERVGWPFLVGKYGTQNGALLQVHGMAGLSVTDRWMNE